MGAEARDAWPGQSQKTSKQQPLPVFGRARAAVGSALTPFRFAVPGVDAATLPVTSLAAVDDSSFLIGTRSNGAFYAEGGTVKHADHAFGLPDDAAESMDVVPRTISRETDLALPGMERTGGFTCFLGHRIAGAKAGALSE